MYSNLNFKDALIEHDCVKVQLMGISSTFRLHCTSALDSSMQSTVFLPASSSPIKLDNCVVNAP